MTPRLFDCFTYFNEALMLEFRLRYLQEVVDIFVIVESCYTFTGARKPLGAKAALSNLPETLTKKVRLVEVHECPTGSFHPTCNWEREAYQRNAIMRGLGDLHEDDLLLITDVDEIPDAATISTLKSGLRAEIGAMNLSMHMFYYQADNQMFAGDTPVQWQFPKLVRPSHLMSPQTTRMAGKHFPSTDPVGWHLSYMGSNEQISHKIRSFSHQEYNTETIHQEIAGNRLSNKDPFGRDHSFRKYPIEKLPELIRLDERFKSFFLPEEL